MYMSEASRARKLARRTRRAERKALKKARKEARRLERRTLKEAHRARKEARRLERQTQREEIYDPYEPPSYAHSVAPAASRRSNLRASVAPAASWRSGLDLRAPPGQTFPEWEKIVTHAIDSLGGIRVSNTDVSRTLDSSIDVDIEIDGEVATPDKLNVVETLGDGSCLVHAFLTSCSALYRAIPYSHRERVGQEVRRQLRLPGPATSWLGDEYIFHLTRIARNSVIYMTMQADYTENVRIVGDSGPYIILANQDGVHYTSVTFQNKYVVKHVFI
jgi:hypothetical protein